MKKSEASNIIFWLSEQVCISAKLYYHRDSQAPQPQNVQNWIVISLTYTTSRMNECIIE